MTVLVGDELKCAHDEAAGAALAASTKLTDLSNRKAGVQQEIESLQSKYDEECQRLAAGQKGADPASVLDELDRRRHELRGLKGLVAQAQAEHDPLYAKAKDLGNQLLNYQESQQIEALIARQINLERAAAEAEKNLQEARAALATTTNELSAFRVQTERRRNPGGLKLERRLWSS